MSAKIYLLYFDLYLKRDIERPRQVPFFRLTVFKIPLKMDVSDKYNLFNALWNLLC